MFKHSYHIAIVVIVALAGGSIAAVVGSKLGPTDEQRQVYYQEETKDWRQKRANSFVASNLHIKDPRTKTCYAYNVASGYFAVVPEQSIPPELLVVAKVK